MGKISLYEMLSEIIQAIQKENYTGEKKVRSLRRNETANMWAYINSIFLNVLKIHTTV